ncbi:sensor histidine kinase [Desemzia sp. RIT804]|uniref:sensor histidine kinase n=1 Tax=Desemzia sp. RIT 804 TaxID=2810209 RepID=UPI00194E9B13|nr:sensor histidine kinase [Desemzia sp. RIT 804]MBM6614489.1 sensor histidine kinase [Desemzia sp. RIT 804]
MKRNSFIKRKSTIQLKLLSMYVIVLIIPIVLVGYYLSIELRENLIETKTKEIEQNTEKIESDLFGAMSNIILISDWLYQDQELRTILETDYTSDYEIFRDYQRYEMFSDYLKYYDELANIRFFVVNETLRSSLGLFPTTDEISQQGWYQRAVEKRGQFTWEYMNDPVTKQPLLYLTRSVFDGEQFLGVLTIAMSNQKIEHILSSSTNPVFITLNDETPIFSYPKAENILVSYGPYENIVKLKKVSDENSVTAQEEVNNGPISLNIRKIEIPKVHNSQMKVIGLVPTNTILTEANHVLANAYLVVAMVFGITLLLLYTFIRRFNKRILRLQDAMTKVAHGDFSIPSTIDGTDEITDVYEQLYLTMESLQQLIENNYSHQLNKQNWEIQKKESEFKLLASQINPHFLYNTLEMIRMKALRNSDREVAEIVKILSKLMRKALERNHDEQSLTDELKFIEMYLQIQKLRFGERISYTITKEFEEDYLILPMVLQPLVENSFVHGIEPKAERGHIYITVSKYEEDLVLVIQDNGIGIPEEKLKSLQEMLIEAKDSDRIGLSNVNLRLKQYYGPEYGVIVDSKENEGTTITITLPLKETRQNKGE